MVYKPIQVSVTYKGKALKEKKNYVLKYSKGCKKVGTYTVQIIGKGAYAGKVKKQELTISNSENTPCLVIRLQKQWH